MKNNELDNTTTDRIKPPHKVSEPFYINLEDLEAIQEFEFARRRERVQEFKSRNW